MSASTQTKWHIAGESVVTCNCAWGCQFNAAPTTGPRQAAEMANAVRIHAQGGGVLDFGYHDTYAQLNSFDWANG